MLDIEGFGILEFPWSSTSEKEMMFFQVKNKMISLDDVLGNNQIPGLEEKEDFILQDSLQTVDYFQAYLPHAPLLLTHMEPISLA